MLYQPLESTGLRVAGKQKIIPFTRSRQGQRKEGRFPLGWRPLPWYHKNSIQKKKKRQKNRKKKPIKQHQAKRAGCSTPYSKHQPALALLSPWCRGRHFYFKAKSQTILSNCMQPHVTLKCIFSMYWFVHLLWTTFSLRDRGASTRRAIADGFWRISWLPCRLLRK